MNHLSTKNKCGIVTYAKKDTSTYIELDHQVGLHEQGEWEDVPSHQRT